MKVLLIGRNANIMEQSLSQVRAAEFDAQGAILDVDALRLLRNETFDVVAIGGGVQTDSRATFHRVAREKNSAVIVLDIYGPETLLPRLKKLKNPE
jgi:ACT domain-containing protein